MGIIRTLLPKLFDYFRWVLAPSINLYELKSAAAQSLASGRITPEVQRSLIDSLQPTGGQMPRGDMLPDIGLTIISEMARISGTHIMSDWIFFGLFVWLLAELVQMIYQAVIWYMKRRKGIRSVKY